MLRPIPARKRRYRSVARREARPAAIRYRHPTRRQSAPYGISNRHTGPCASAEAGLEAVEPYAMIPAAAFPAPHEPIPYSHRAEQGQQAYPCKSPCLSNRYGGKQIRQQTGARQHIQTFQRMIPIAKQGVDGSHMGQRPAALRLDAAQPHRVLAGAEQLRRRFPGNFMTGKQRVDMRKMPMLIAILEGRYLSEGGVKTSGSGSSRSLLSPPHRPYNPNGPESAPVPLMNRYRPYAHILRASAAGAWPS